MSAAVMSNYYSSQLQVHNWMLAQMNNQNNQNNNGYPPPPQQQDQHYNGLYPAQGGAQQMLDPSQQEQLQFSSLNQPIYPKVETLPGTGHNSPASQHIQSLTHDLHHPDDQPRHYISHVSQHLQQPTPVTSHPTSAAGLSQPPTQTTTPEQPQKTNRLRKACDSCSIRKVKVCRGGEIGIVASPNFSSAMRPGRRAELVQHSTFRVHSIDLADDEDHRIDMQKLSNEDASKSSRMQARQALAYPHQLPLPTPPTPWQLSQDTPQHLSQQSRFAQSIPWTYSSTTSSPTSIRYARSHTSPAFARHGSIEKI